MILKRIADTPANPVQHEGAEKAAVRVLFGPEDGSPTCAMRQFEIGPEGSTPHHAHPFEHQILILEGQFALVTEKGEVPVSPGDAIMIMPQEKHQFKNTSKTQSAKLLCIVPVEFQK